MSRRFQFGFEHVVVTVAATTSFLLGNPQWVVAGNGTAASCRAQGFAIAVPEAMAVATVISIAVACGALMAGETLRALRFLCPSASLFASWLTLFIAPVLIFDRSERSSEFESAGEIKPLYSEPAVARSGLNNNSKAGSNGASYQSPAKLLFDERNRRHTKSAA